MFWTLIQKDILHFIRMKRELLVLLLMPAVLIAILGFSLGSFLDSKVPSLQMELAIIQEGDPKEDWERFKQEVARSPVAEGGTGYDFASGGKLFTHGSFGESDFTRGRI